MKHLVQGITTWLIEQKAILEEEQEIYEYSVRTFLITIISVVTGIVIGTLVDGFLYSIVFVISFLLLRKYSGGYHAKSFGRCMCYSCILLVGIFSVAKNLHCLNGVIVITIVSVASLCYFSPIASEERALSEAEKQENKRCVRSILFVYGLIILGSLLLGQETCVIRLSLGIILTAVLQFPCICKNN